MSDDSERKKISNIMLRLLPYGGFIDKICIMNKTKRHRNYLLKTIRVYFLFATKAKSQDNDSGPQFREFSPETCGKVVVSDEIMQAGVW
jgi:hypothetical protein